MKIFCIGFNKTGTSSLHLFFQRAGIRSIHDDLWPRVTYLPAGKQLLEKFDAYSDGEQCDFRQLKSWFPDAAFILNTRDDRDWLTSRIKHVLRFGNFELTEALENPALGVMAHEFFTEPRAALTKWIREKRLYEARVRGFFASDPHFLELDVIRQTDWPETLYQHLSALGFNPCLDAVASPIHENKRELDKHQQSQLVRRYVDLLPQILDA